MGDARVPTRAEIEHAAAFRAELRRFLARAEAITGEAGLTPQRYDLLLAIKNADGEATINELCAALDMRQTAVTELVKRAEEAGLTVRTQSTVDRRVVLVTLTPEAERRFAQGFAGLDGERSALGEALSRLTRTFEAPAPELHPALEPPATLEAPPPAAA